MHSTVMRRVLSALMLLCLLFQTSDKLGWERRKTRTVNSAKRTQLSQVKSAGYYSKYQRK
jgi:hypothetical protein